MTVSEVQATVNEQYRRDAISGCFNRVQLLLYKAVKATNEGTAAQYRAEADRLIQTELRGLTERSTE